MPVREHGAGAAALAAVVLRGGDAMRKTKKDLTGERPACKRVLFAFGRVRDGLFTHVYMDSTAGLARLGLTVRPDAFGAGLAGRHVKVWVEVQP